MMCGNYTKRQLRSLFSGRKDNSVGLCHNYGTFFHYSWRMCKIQVTHSHLQWGYWKQPVWSEALHWLLLYFPELNSSQQDDSSIYFPRARYEPTCSWGPWVSPYCWGSRPECQWNLHLQRLLPGRTLTSWLKEKNHTGSLPEKKRLQVEYVRHLLQQLSHITSSPNLPSKIPKISRFP